MFWAEERIPVSFAALLPGGRGSGSLNRSLSRALREHDDAKVRGLSIGRYAEAELYRTGAQILHLADALHRAHHVDVIEMTSAVLPGLNLGGGRRLHDNSVQVSLGQRRARGRRNGTGDVFAIERRCRQCEGDLRSLRGLSDGGQSLLAIVAQELSRAVDNHLRRVRIIELQSWKIVVLAIGELRGGETVMPPSLVPVVNVFLQRNDVCALDRLFAIETGQKSIGRWATGAPFGGKK